MTELRLVVCSDEVELADVVAEERQVGTDVELVHVDARERDTSDLLTLVSQLPMFATRQRVLVSGLTSLGVKELTSFVEQAGRAPGPNEVVVLLVGEPPSALRGHPGLDDRRRGRGAAARQAVEAALRAEGLRVDAAALEELERRLGEDVSFARSVARTLGEVVGEGGVVHLDDLEAVAVVQGGRAPWELTDAIETGDVRRAVDTLQVLLEAGTPDALVLAVLERRVLELLAVADSGASDSASVNAALREVGLRARPEFAARRLATLARALGPERAARLVTLVATTARDLRGESLAPAPGLLSLLVARLASLMPPLAQQRSGGGLRDAPGRGRRSGAGSRSRDDPPSARARG